MKKLDRYFINERLGLELDIYEDNGKEWFLGTDVAKFFGFRDNSNMVRMITEPEIHSCPHIVRGAQNNEYQATMIDEYALYEITVKIRNTDAERYQKAKEFRDWVFGELLPELRKNGGYLDITETDDIISTLSKMSTILETAAKRYKELRDQLFIANNEVKCGVVSDVEKMQEIDRLNKEIARIKQATKEFLQFKVTEYCNTHGVVKPNNLLDYARLAREVIGDDIPITDFILD